MKTTKVPGWLTGNNTINTEIHCMVRAYRNLMHLETTSTVANNLEIADTLWKRSVGLIGRKSLDANSGLWIEPCGGIHTFLMRFAIDVLFLDNDGTITRIDSNIKPWRFCLAEPNARIIIELPAGSAANHQLKIGDRLMLNTAPPPIYS